MSAFEGSLTVAIGAVSDAKTVGVFDGPFPPLPAFFGAAVCKGTGAGTIESERAAVPRYPLGKAGVINQFAKRNE